MHPLGYSLSRKGLESLPNITQRGFCWTHDRTAGFEHWGAAVNRTNLGDRPPDEHLLLRDARVALARDDYRRCVLDLATACEIVVTAAVEEDLRSRLGGEFDVTSLLGKNRQIERVLTVAKALGVLLPEALQTVVLEPRSRAIHRNARVVAAEARDAVAMTTDLLAKHSPLDP